MTTPDLASVMELAAALEPDLSLEDTRTTAARWVTKIMSVSRCEIRVGGGERSRSAGGGERSRSASGGERSRSAGAGGADREAPDTPRPKVDRPRPELHGEETRLSVPLRLGEQVLGELSIAKAGDLGQFTDEDDEKLRSLAVIVAVAIRDARARERQERQSGQMARLFEATRAVTSTLVLEDVLMLVARTTAEVMGTFASDIFDYSAADNAMIASAYWALEVTPADTEYLGHVISLDERPGYYPYAAQPRLLEQQLDDPESFGAGEWEVAAHWGERSSLIAPLIYGGELIGLLGCTEKRFARHFSDEDKELFQQLAVPAALAIHNARVYREQEQQARRFASLVDASRAITSSLVLDDVLDLVARTAAQTLACPECAIYDYDEGADTLTPRSLYRTGRSHRDEAAASHPVRESAAHRTLRERGQIRVDTLSDPALDAEVRASMSKRGEQTRLNVPLHLGDEPLGTFVLIETEREREFTDEEIELVRGLGEQASLALHNARLFRRLELHSRETALLNDIARAASGSLSMTELAAAAIAQLRRLIRIDRASLLMCGEDGALDVVYSTEHASELLGLVMADIDAAFRLRLEHERIVMLRLPADRPLERQAGDGLRSVAVVAICDADRLIGALVMGSDRDKAYSDGDRRILHGMSAQLSLAVCNARLFDNVRRLHLGNLRALSSALTAKDFYTSGHTARVAAYVTLLARELGWSAQAVAGLKEVTYLHDIGKIAISDRVLLKSGPLTDEEWSLMNQHPSIGAEILAPLFDERLVAGIRHHHERYDGKGYPSHLAGEEIPEIARLLCVVDSYDAMSSRRVYRKALTYQECLDELSRCRGSQFDPAMVDAFVRVLNRLDQRRQLVSSVAQVAADRADAQTIAALVGSSDGPRSEYARAEATLRKVRAEFPNVDSLVVVTRVDEQRLRVLVDSDENTDTWIHPGEIAFSNDLEREVFAGRLPESNVISVDSWGTWVEGVAPICGPSGEALGLVCASVSPAEGFEPRGPGSAVNDMFAGIARSAAARLTKAETDAMTDPLTGLYNHRHIQEHLETAVSEAREGETQVSVLFCDLDRFKDLNDRLGHAAGDEVLRSVAQILCRSVRPSDVAARYGGDEFAIVLAGVGCELAGSIAERIRAGVEGATLGAANEALTISIGIAALGDHVGTKEQLLEQADKAMYAAKREGRNRVVAFPLA